MKKWYAGLLVLLLALVGVIYYLSVRETDQPPDVQLTEVPEEDIRRPTVALLDPAEVREPRPVSAPDVREIRVPDEPDETDERADPYRRTDPALKDRLPPIDTREVPSEDVAVDEERVAPLPWPWMSEPREMSPGFAEPDRKDVRDPSGGSGRILSVPPPKGPEAGSYHRQR
jgi:hypothetical protein